MEVADDEPPYVNWRKRKRDREIRRMAIALWDTRKMDTAEIASVISVPESAVYNALAKHRVAK